MHGYRALAISGCRRAHRGDRIGRPGRPADAPARRHQGARCGQRQGDRHVRSVQRAAATISRPGRRTATRWRSSPPTPKPARRRCTSPADGKVTRAHHHQRHRQQRALVARRQAARRALHRAQEAAGAQGRAAQVGKSRPRRTSSASRCRPATGDIRQVSPADLYIYEYDWTPDGRASPPPAHGNGDNNWWMATLYHVDAATGELRILATPAANENPRGRPTARRSRSSAA